MSEVADQLWNDLRELFAVDDGSLPEFRVDFQNERATVAGYALLRSRSVVVSEGAWFWSNVNDREESLDSVPNAAALVVSNEASAFHVLLRVTHSLGVTLPDLGVFVFSNQLALDYRMGPEWAPVQVEALVRLVFELAALDPEAALSLA